MRMLLAIPRMMQCLLETLMFLDVAIIKVEVHFVCRNNFQKHA